MTPGQGTVREWRELVEAGIHKTSRFGQDCFGNQVSEVHSSEYNRPCIACVHAYGWAAYHKRCYEMAQKMELVSGKTGSVEYASDERRPPLMD